MKNYLTISLLLFSVILFPTGTSAQQKGASPLPKSLPTGQAGEIQNTKSATYAVVVGISDYQDEGIPDLRFADRDAEAFANFLRSPAGGGLDEDHLKLLINEGATVAQFAKELDWLLEVVKENDKVLIYFSGHGDVERKTLTQPGFLLCWDAPARVYLAGGTLALPMFQEIISTLSIQNQAKVVVITDACRSGKLSGSSVGGSQLTNSNLSKQYTNEIKILSCQPDEYSIEGEQWGGGRGAFSYHLLDGLYGMADGNADSGVDLKEIGRYLEDHVTEEVAPESQNPMVIGNKTEKLVDVFPEILAQVREGRRGQLQIFTTTESRGIEDEVLAAADSNIVEMYAAFQRAIKDKKFFEPADACADLYYEILSKKPQLERLHSSMRRNYAAALQDDAQQVMNKWLKTDPIELSLSKKSRIEKYQLFPLYLGRAADLLGHQHFAYSYLQGQKHFFEGYLLSISCQYPTKELCSKILSHYQQTIRWQVDMPHTYWQMSWVYGNFMMLPDSAEYYANRAVSLAPSWVLPYTNLAYLFTKKIKDLPRAKFYLELASNIDTNSVFVYQGWGIYHMNCKQFGEAETQFKKAIALDSNYAFVYHNLGKVYANSRRFLEAELLLKRALQIDSTYAFAHNNLANIYFNSKRFDEAEQEYIMAIQLDSSLIDSYLNLGLLYMNMDYLTGAEQQLKTALLLDSTNLTAHVRLGNLFLRMHRFTEAETQNLFVLQFSTNNNRAYYTLACIKSHLNEIELSEEYLKLAFENGWDNYNWMQQDPDLALLRDHKERWNALMKKYFPDQYKD